MFFSPRVSKIYENTTYLTIVRGPQKYNNQLCCNNNNNKKKKKKKKNKNKKHKKKNKHKNVTKKMCGNGYKLRYDKNITLCSVPARTRRAHEQHQRSHFYT